MEAAAEEAFPEIDGTVTLKEMSLSFGQHAFTLLVFNLANGEFKQLAYDTC